MEYIEGPRWDRWKTFAGCSIAQCRLPTVCRLAAGEPRRIAELKIIRIHAVSDYLILPSTPAFGDGAPPPASRLRRLPGRSSASPRVSRDTIYNLRPGSRADEIQGSLENKISDVEHRISSTEQKLRQIESDIDDIEAKLRG
jgi:hypothetical protein